MERFDKYIGPSYENSTCDLGNKKSFLNNDSMSSLKCEKMTEVCDTQNNMDCRTTNHPNKTHGEDIMYENIPPLAGYNVQQLLPNNVVRIDSKLILDRNIENAWSSMEFIKSEENELEEGELKMGNLQLLTKCEFTGYTPNMGTMSEEPKVYVADMSVRLKHHCVTLTQKSNQDLHCKFVKIESVEPQVSEGSDVDVICRSTRTESNCLPVSEETEVYTDSNSTGNNIHNIPVSEESDVDLLYAYYTCVSPERKENKLFKDIKSEPWIEVSQLQEILPGERIKVEDDASMTQSPTKYGRKVIKKEHNTIPDLLETEPNSRKDIMRIPKDSPDHTISSSPFLGQVNDCRFSPLKLLKTWVSNETNNTTWQPVVVLENISESIPRHSCVNQERSFSAKKRKRGPENIQPCKKRVDRPVHGVVFPTNISTYDKGDVQPISTDIFSKDKARRITETSVEKGHNSSTPVTEKRVTSPDVDDNGTPEKLSNSVSKIDTITTKCCKPSSTVSDIRLTDVDLGDDVATGSQGGCYVRPKRQSAIKAVEKLQESMEGDENDTNLDEIDSENSDYEGSDVSASDDEIDVNDGSNSSNPSQTLVINTQEVTTDFFCAACERYFRNNGTLKRHNFSTHGKLPENTKPKKCTYCATEFLDEPSLKQHMSAIHNKERKTDFFCGVCERYFKSDAALTRHNFFKHREVPKNVKIIKCNICTKESLGEKQLKQHLFRQHNKEVITDFFCAVCEQYFQHDGFLKRHNFSMHGKLPENTKPQRCTICAAEFFDEVKLGQHMSKLHNKELKTDFSCAECERGFQSDTALTRHNLSKHREVPELKTDFSCAECERCFQSDTALTRHNLSKHREVPKNVKVIKCNICTRACLGEKQLEIHLIQQHNKKGEPKKYQCEICHRQFLLKGTMLRHKQIMHVQERRCVCEVCGQVFDQSSKLIVHMENHRKRYQCHICSTFCSTTYNLKTHMLSHTGEKPHKCEVCEQAFTRIDNLKLHLKLMHKDVLRYECKKCNKKFKTNKLKQEHQRQEHIVFKGPRLTACKLCGEMLSKVKEGPHEIRHKTGKIMKCEKCETHVTLTHLCYKYKIKDKDEKYQTVCYGCFEEYAKQYKPEDYHALSRKCKLPGNCKYCGKSVAVRYLNGHESTCRRKGSSTDNRAKDAGSNDLDDDSPSSENVFEDKNMTLPSMASDQGSRADIQGTHSSSSEIV